MQAIKITKTCMSNAKCDDFRMIFNLKAQPSLDSRHEVVSDPGN